MSTFPSLMPSTRTFSPGEYPHTPQTGINGHQSRTRHSNVMLSSQLRLGFSGITQTDMLSILTHYQGQLGTYASFALPSAVFSGVSAAGDYTLTGYSWRYSEPPTVDDLPCNSRHNVELVLESVPPEGAAITGLASVVTVTLSAGSAAAANGLDRTIAVTLAAGTASGT